MVSDGSDSTVKSSARAAFRSRAPAMQQHQHHTCVSKQQTSSFQQRQVLTAVHQQQELQHSTRRHQRYTDERPQQALSATRHPSTVRQHAIKRRPRHGATTRKFESATILEHSRVQQRGSQAQCIARGKARVMAHHWQRSVSDKRHRRFSRWASHHRRAPTSCSTGKTGTCFLCSEFAQRFRRAAKGGDARPHLLGLLPGRRLNGH